MNTDSTTWIPLVLGGTAWWAAALPETGMSVVAQAPATCSEGCAKAATEIRSASPRWRGRPDGGRGAGTGRIATLVTVRVGCCDPTLDTGRTPAATTRRPVIAAGRMVGGPNGRGSCPDGTDDL